MNILNGKQMKWEFYRRISLPVTLLKTGGLVRLCRYNVDLVETAGRASLTYLSTLAVLQLDAILQNAKLCFVDKPKPANKHQAKFEKMLGMDYSCPGIGDIQLMVGVRKRDKTKIQYCITAITPTLRKKKGSHK